MNAGKGSTAGREPTWHRPAWPLGATLRGLSPHSPLLSSDDPRLRVRAPAPGLPWTHPAHRPPSHPAERSEGAEGQEVVEHRQGPGAQSQGGSGHAAQLPQSPPQGQLGEVQPAGHMSPRTASVRAQGPRSPGSPTAPRAAPSCPPARSKPTSLRSSQPWPCPSPQPHSDPVGRGCVWSAHSLPCLPACPSSEDWWELGAAGEAQLLAPLWRRGF